MLCPNCHAQNADTQKFCNQCGTQLTQQQSAPQNSGVSEFNPDSFATQDMNDFFAPVQTSPAQPAQQNSMPQSQPYTYNPNQPMNSAYSQPQNPQVQYTPQNNGYGANTYNPNSYNSNPYNPQRPAMNFSSGSMNAIKTDMPMNFHTFYWIMCFIASGFSLISLIGTMVSGEGTFGSLIISLAAIAFNVITGIFLMQRKRAGNIMRLISNICGIVSGGFSILGALIIFLMGAALASEIESLGVAIGGMIGLIGFIVLIYGIGSIIYNIIVMKYYSKRKHMFY